MLCLHINSLNRKSSAEQVLVSLFADEKTKLSAAKRGGTG